MARVLDLDLAAQQDRTAIARQAGAVASAAYKAAPKRPIALYGSLLVALMLWIIPIRYQLRTWFTLSTTILAAAMVAGAKTGLERWQDELEDAEDDQAYSKAVRRQAIQQVTTTQRYTEATAARLQVSGILPDHLKEGDLVDPQVAKQADFDDFKQMMGLRDKPGADTPALPDDTNDDGVVAASPSKYRFFKRKNAQSSTTERCVDLNGHTHYAGLPIVDVALEMAKESRGCIGVGPTGTGKSQLLKQAIAAQDRLCPATDFTVFAHKSSNQSRGERLDYCGLEDSDDLYLLTASMNGPRLEEAATRFHQRLISLQGIMERGSQVPSVVVIDQINQGIKAANKAERQAARLAAEDEEGDGYYPYKHLEEIYKDDLSTMLVDGREKCVKAWVFGHANTNEALGLGHQIKENVFYLGLGRDGIYSAVLNPLKNDRFIAVTAERQHLIATFQEYITAHKEYGSPVNVVLALTNCGHEGWRLVVLPQLSDPDPITLGVTNPKASTHTQAINAADAPAPPVTTAPPSPDTTEVDAARRALDAQFNNTDKTAQYSPAQTRTATQFIQWLKQRRHDFIDAQGLLDPETVSYAYDGVRSLEAMHAILQMIVDLGYGAWETHPHTHERAWRLKGAVPILVAPAERQEPAPPVAIPPSENTPELKPLPGGITEEMFKLVLFYLNQKQPTSLLTPNGFLTGSHKLSHKDSDHKMTTAQMRMVLKYLDTLGVVKFPKSTDSQFTFLGFPKPPDA